MIGQTASIHSVLINNYPSISDGELVRKLGIGNIL